jgi:hypothetical protein
MSETELTILRQTQQMLDEEIAHFVGLSGPARAIETEQWFRREIAKAIAKEIAPLIARIVQLETKPMPSATALNPSRQWEKICFATSSGRHSKSTISASRGLNARSTNSKANRPIGNIAAYGLRDNTKRAIFARMTDRCLPACGPRKASRAPLTHGSCVASAEKTRPGRANQHWKERTGQ